MTSAWMCPTNDMPLCYHMIDNMIGDTVVPVLTVLELDDNILSTCVK